MKLYNSLSLLQGHLLFSGASKNPALTRNVFRRFSTAKASNATQNSPPLFNKFQGGVFVLPHQ